MNLKLGFRKHFAENRDESLEDGTASQKLEEKVSPQSDNSGVSIGVEIISVVAVSITIIFREAVSTFCYTF